MLTAVTVVLTALAIGIGILAAYTFRELKDEAKAAAAKTAREVAADTAQKRADEALSEVVIWRRLLQITEKQKKRPWEEELAPGYDPTDMGER
jgi:sensor histidine kinase regulating citrate/malate metabolism